MKDFVCSNPAQAAVVGLLAIVLSPVVIMAGLPVVQFLLVQLAPVLVPALVLAVVSGDSWH